MADNHLLFLPQEMVTEIMLRLPSKSLIRFKSACKSWCTLFSDSRFMANHLLPDHLEHNGKLLLVMGRDETTRDYVLSFLSDDTLDAHHSTPTLSLPPFPGMSDEEESSYYSYFSVVQIVGPCCPDGLMCLSYKLTISHIVLWRPSTGYLKILPNVPPPESNYTYPPDIWRGPYYGFGYDADSQDHKVIRMNITISTVTDERDTIFEVYSVKTDSWRVKTDSWRAVNRSDRPVVLLCDTPHEQKYINGIYVWLALVGDEAADLNGILWFRMNDESFGATKLPPNDDITYHSQLLPLNDTIGIIMFRVEPGVECSYHVWALLELEVEDSWTPLYTLGPLVGIERPVWFWKKGKMIMKDDDGDLVLCDPFSQEMVYLDVVGGLSNQYWWRRSYVQIVAIQDTHIFQTNQ